MMDKKLQHILYIMASIVMISVLFACESEKRPEPVEANLPEVVSFSEHIIPIFQGKGVGVELTGRGRKCTDCHNGTTPPDLTSDNAYLELTAGGFIDTDVPESSKLYEKIAPGGSMNSYTNNVDIEYILEWIKEGALEN